MFLQRPFFAATELQACERSFSLQSLLHRRSSAAHASSGVLFQHVKHSGFVFQTFNTLRLLQEHITRTERGVRGSKPRVSLARLVPLST